MKNSNNLIWLLALLLIVISACSEDEESESNGSISKITINVNDITSTSAVVSFPILEESHIYTISLFDTNNDVVDMDFISTGMFPDDEVVDGVATLDPFIELTPSSEYKVKIKGTRNIYNEGATTIALDSVMFSTLAE